MTENTVNVENTGFQITETVTNKGYVDKDGKFHSADESTVVEAGYVQTPADVQ